MGKPKQKMLMMLSIIHVITFHCAGASSRILALPESVQDKQETPSVASLEVEEEMVCEPSGPCINCAGSESLSLTECMATSRKQAFRCLPHDGESRRVLLLFSLTTMIYVLGATESSDGPEQGDPLIVYRSCQRTEEDEEFRLLRFQLFCFMGGIASFVQVRKQKAVSASLFDQRKQQAAVEMVETQSLVSNNSRDEADVV